MDKQTLKNKLIQYLEFKGIEIFGKGKDKKIYCLVHSESNPSATVNKDKICCHGCGAVYDIFDCAAILDGIKGWPNQLKYIANIFGINAHDVRNIKPETRKPIFRGYVEHKDSISLNINAARKVYAVSRLNELAEYAGLKDYKFKSAYPYFTEKGLIKCVDVRFENKKNQKQVITIWYNGKNLKMSNSPNWIWGLDHLYKNKYALIVEGAKCAKLGQDALGKYFDVFTWNRGSNAVCYGNWEPIKKYRYIYFLIDHDEKTNPKTGKLLSPEKQPGMKCAIELKKIIPHLEIVEPPIEAIKIKQDGCDIEECLQIMSPEELKNWVFNYKCFMRLCEECKIKETCKEKKDA